ncbi:MAG: hypothetical protein AAFU49_16535 [Pseudomonadota bacterium]
MVDGRCDFDAGAAANATGTGLLSDSSAVVLLAFADAPETVAASAEALEAGLFFEA